MKLLHLGDLHLGKNLGDFDLKDDQEHILKQILNIVKEKEVDTVLIAGDVYDKSLPSETAVNQLDFFLCELAKLKVNTFMISGNHDSDDRLNYGRSLFEVSHVYISSIFDGVLHHQTISDDAGETDVYLLPFVKASQVKHFFPDADIKNYEDAVRVILENTEIDESRRNVIVAHQFVSGKNADPEIAGSEGLSVKSVGLVEKIGYNIFDKFDYVALGHIHSPQSVGREEIRYSGSPLKYSLSEVNNHKSVPVVTLKAKGETEIELVPLTPLRDVRHIKGPMKKILMKENIKDPNDFVYITLTDEEIINDAMGIVQQYYKNTVSINYENSSTREVDRVDISQITEDRSFEQIVEGFYQMVYGTEMTEEEKALLKDVAKKVGVVNETD